MGVKLFNLRPPSPTTKQKRNEKATVPQTKADPCRYKTYTAKDAPPAREQKKKTWTHETVSKIICARSQFATVSDSVRYSGNTLSTVVC